MGRSIRLPCHLTVPLLTVCPFCPSTVSVCSTEADVEKIVDWTKTSKQQVEIPFKPARVLMQDFTGVPGPTHTPRQACTDSDRETCVRSFLFV